MTLTPDQLTAIDRHLRKENWLLNEALITELTDHYIDGISERMGQGMTFDTAIREIHQNFGGRKSLLKMEEEYQQSQTKQMGRIMRNTVRSYFQLPRFGFTLLILTLVYGLIRLLPANLDLDWTSSWLFIGLLAVTTILYIMALLSIIGNYRQSSKAKARNQGLVTLFQVINSFLLVGFYIRMWLPIDKVLIQYPLPSSVLITLFVVFELAAIEVFFTYSSPNQSLKPAQ